ncbi:cytochrome P450 [Aspergillus bertholletiae]|uniref:Benzoate 4-monooxygenase bphA n=1 Tax=Aspergillus bertholletiae TaxID=1226010 RepID=A0A5N7B6Q0_9EURO|nr:cytochrome P450 [Aspergillus bertholletiae]
MLKMTDVETALSVQNLQISLVSLAGLMILYYFVPYVKQWRLRDIPAPGVAAFSHLWLVFQGRRGTRTMAIDKLHKTHGKMIRVAPRHISIADDSAIQAVYGHGNGFLKAEFYDAFLNVYRSIFTSRNRVEHTRKRKAISHAFSVKSIAQVEKYAHANIEMFLKQWRSIAENKKNPQTGFATFDALIWFNYLSFDIVGDLAFGAPFGMLEHDRDVVEMRKDPKATPTYINAVEVLNRRGEVAATLGACPALIPYAKWLPDPFFRLGAEAISNLAGIATSAVNRRLSLQGTAEERTDILTRLIESKDDNGNKLGRLEITGEALTMITGGSDTTSNTFGALLYWVLRTPRVLTNLQKVLDASIPPEVDVPTFDMVKNITYLQWVIWEALRIHSTFGLGLPREIPPDKGPVEICGHTFHAGDILSVPIYTVHHSPEIWGIDVEDFVPERWDPERLTQRQKGSFIPFSTGPRACIGRNLAEMELFVGCATFFRLFDMRLEQKEPMKVVEGFLRKPAGLTIGIKRREPEGR